MRWDVDDRAPTPWTRLYVRGMWLSRDKEAFEGAEHTRETALEKQDSGNAPPTWPTRLLTRVRRTTSGGMTVWVARPRRTQPAARVVYVHGGGYVHPLTPDYWRLVRALARVPAEVVVPAYPLAPDAPVDEVLPALLEVVVEADRRAPGLPTVLMGDSAGGALVLAMARRLHDEGGVQPVGVVPLCPWLDAALQDESVPDLEASDPMLAESGLRAAGRWWAGPRDTTDPLVSPVNIPLGGLPPIDVWIGRHDILRPAVSNLAERAEREGADLHVHEVTAMFHVWMTRAIPEALRTRRALVRFVRDRAER